MFQTLQVLRPQGGEGVDVQKLPEPFPRVLPHQLLEVLHPLLQQLQGQDQVQGGDVHHGH